MDREQVKQLVQKYDFATPIAIHEAIDYIIGGLKNHSVHVARSGYLGLFNPRTSFASTIADPISATFNSQLATWDHSPFAVEVESYLINQIGLKFGIKNAQGSFTAGGAEANLTGILCALTAANPNHRKMGLLGLAKRPMIYCSVESHHSITKAARVLGLGSNSIRQVPTNDHQQMDPVKLAAMVAQDSSQSNLPCLVIGTAGTTGTGAIDRLAELAKVCRSNRMWLHVDAAYGGAVALSDNTRHWLAGIQHANSVTFDFHKMPSLPIGTSVFITPHADVLRQAFGISTAYMKDMVGPYENSIQWSRRFIGLRLLIVLLVHGWKGFEDLIDRQVQQGDYLRRRLIESNWKIKNKTRLPVVCFTDSQHQSTPDFVPTIGKGLEKSGMFWVSTYTIGGIKTIRACVANYTTRQSDLDRFVHMINDLRHNYRQNTPDK